MRKRLLVVSPNFPPVNLPDHMRVRSSLPYYAGLGWDAHVLAVDHAHRPVPLDPLLLAGLPADVTVTRARSAPAGLARAFGGRAMAYRAALAIGAAGDALLRRERFDAVYFSTTTFPAMLHGPRWRARFGVPYVVDLQDPWLTDHYARTGARPPGGALLFGASSALARIGEPRVLRAAAHVVCVTQAYVDMMRARYPDLPASRFTVMPFGAAESDYDLALGADDSRVRDPAGQGLLEVGPGLARWAYVGRIATSMQTPLRALVRAVGALDAGGVRLCFVGTSYAGGTAPAAHVLPEAAAMGLAHVVREHPARVGYFEALRVNAEADVVIVLGSNDAGYNPSKLYPTLLAHRPILALVQEGSPVVAALAAIAPETSTVITFRPGDDDRTIARRAAAPLAALAARPRLTRAEVAAKLRLDALAPYTTAAVARAECAIFDAVSS